MMTKHYAVPGAPPCRCAWCRHQHLQPALFSHETGNTMPPAVDNFSDAAIRQYQRKRQLAEQERQRIAAEELADWLAQDVT